MSEYDGAQPADQTRAEHRSRFTVARAVLLGALSFGSLIGGAAAASSDPLIGGCAATGQYNTEASNAEPAGHRAG